MDPDRDQMIRRARRQVTATFQAIDRRTRIEMVRALDAAKLSPEEWPGVLELFAKTNAREGCAAIGYFLAAAFEADNDPLCERN